MCAGFPCVLNLNLKKLTTYQSFHSQMPTYGSCTAHSDSCVLSHNQLEVKLIKIKIHTLSNTVIEDWGSNDNIWHMRTQSLVGIFWMEWHTWCLRWRSLYIGMACLASLAFGMIYLLREMEHWYLGRCIWYFDHKSMLLLVVALVIDMSYDLGVLWRRVSMNHYWETKFASYFTIIYHGLHQNTI